MFDFTIIVEGIHGSVEAAKESLDDATCDLFDVSLRDDLLYVEFCSRGDDPEAEINLEIDNVNRANVGTRIVRVERDVVRCSFPECRERAVFQSGDAMLAAGWEEIDGVELCSKHVAEWKARIARIERINYNLPTMSDVYDSKEFARIDEMLRKLEEILGLEEAIGPEEIEEMLARAPD